MERAQSQRSPITYYGIAIAHIHGILQTSAVPIPGTSDRLK